MPEHTSTRMLSGFHRKARSGRRRSRLARRWFAVVAACALIAMGVPLVTAPQAHAALHNIFPADADGTPQGVFYADSALFATMTSDLTGGRVCVVGADVLSPSAANCVSGVAWGSPNTYIGIGTLAGYPLSAPPLAVGTWRLLITDLSGKTGTELSETFEVRPCAGTCDTSAAESQLAPWKDKAATAGDTVESLEYIGAADKAMSLFNNLSGVLTDVVKGGGPIGVMMGIGTGMIEGIFANAWDTHKNMAMSILRPLHATSAKMWGDIARDPARDDFHVDTQPDFVAVPALATDDFEPALTPAELDVMNTYARLTMEATAYGDASRFANERYMGAMNDRKYEPATAQAHAASAFTFQLNQRLRALKEIQPQVAAMDWAQQPVFPDAAALFDVPGQTANDAFQSVITEAQATFASGISEEARASLKACEFYETQPADPSTCPITDEMIDYSEQLWQDADYVAGWQAFHATVTPAGALNAYTAELQGIIDAYDLFGRWMGLKAGEAQVQTPAGQPNRTPVSAFTASATTGAAPLAVTFTSQATDPDSDALGLTWDFAGTRTAHDENPVTHTFTQPGTYWVSLVATDPGGLWHQAVKKIEVYPGDSGPGGEEPVGNQAPIADFSPRNPVLTGPYSPTAEQTFTAVSDDPDHPLSYDTDGDPLTFTWQFGDGTTYTGGTVTKQFEEGYVMSVVLVVSDGWKTSPIDGEVTANWADGTAPGENQPPVASFIADPDSGVSPLQVLFTSTSTDPDVGDVLSYTWDFGDGQGKTGGTTVAHTYTQPDTYTVTLIVSDGQATATATQTITVAGAAAPLAADYTVGKSYDAAKAFNGARMLDTGVPQDPRYPVSNLLLSTGVWQTPGGGAGEHEIIVKLAGEGRALLDRVLLSNLTYYYATKTISVSLTQGVNPFGGYTPVVDHQVLDKSTTPQEFTFAAQTATFLKLTVHDSYDVNYMVLGEISAPTVGRDGGIVSVASGEKASIVSVSSEYGIYNTAENILEPDNSYWSTPSGTIANQAIRVRLRGAGPHQIDTISLRGSTSARSLNEFEVWVSESGDDGTWSKVLDNSLANTAVAQGFPITPVAADYVELRLKNNHGDPTYIYLYELQVLSGGENVASRSEVGGAKVVDFSDQASGTPASNAIALGTAGFWQTNYGHVKDQFVTVELRGNQSAMVDRVSLVSSGYQPKNVEIQTSMDGSAFTTVAQQQLQNVSTEQFVTFPPTDARYVRLAVNDGYIANYLRVNRFSVFANDRGSRDKVPFVDTSTGSPSAWAWDFGDETTSAAQHPTHTFPGPGTYPITLTVTDADDRTNTTTGSYTVPDDDPGLRIYAPSYTVNEGAAVNLTGIEGGLGISQWDWDFDFVKPTGTGSSGPVTFPNDGSYTVRARGLTADRLWTRWYSQDFTVLNAPPYVWAGYAATRFVMGEVLPSPVVITDVAADVLTCTWDWGDGSAKDVINNCTSVTAQIPHYYALPGTYTATLTADDGEGGVGSRPVTFTIAKRPTFLQVTDAVAVGSDLTVTARLNDADTGRAVAGETLQISATGAGAVVGVTGADGRAKVTIPGASGSEDVTASFAGSDVAEPATDLTRRTRAPKADIVFMVDESGSMGSVQSAVKQNLLYIARALGASLDYRLGVVGFANDSEFEAHGHVHAPLNDDLAGYFTGSQALVARGGTANGFDAITVASGYTVESNTADGNLVAFDGMDFRDNAASCAVLVTDAGVNEAYAARPKTTRAQAEAAMATRGTTLFSIIANDQATLDAYGSGLGLAGQSGGDSWLVKAFADDPRDVLEALVTKCVTKASTPDLAVAVDGPAAAVPGDEISVTVTASNAAVIDTPEVAVSLDVPEGLVFASASGGGAVDGTGRSVTWPTFVLDAGDHADFTVTLRVPATGWADVGDFPLEVSAAVGYNGSLGDESNLANNAAAHMVTVHVTEPSTDPDPDPDGDVGIGIDIPADSAPGPGDEVTYPLTVTYEGSGLATDVVVLQQVPDRLLIEDIVIPGGWKNGYDDSLVGAHPDGKTPGTWIYLTAAEMEGPPPPFEITATLQPLVLPAVVEGEGRLDADLPAVATIDAAGPGMQACISATQGDRRIEHCDEASLPTKDIVANVTVRLSGGITYLIVSVAVTDSLAGKPITLTWSPGGFDAGIDYVDAAPDGSIVIPGLEPGRNYIVTWPGAAFDRVGQSVDGGTELPATAVSSTVLTQWPGWRAVTDADVDDDGNVLMPAADESAQRTPMTADQRAAFYRGERIYDASTAEAIWRDPSTVTFSINPHVSFQVEYREEVPAAGTGPVDPGPTDPGSDATPGGSMIEPQSGGQPGAQSGSQPGNALDAHPQSPELPTTVDVAGEHQEIVPGRQSAAEEVIGAGPLATTGPRWLLELILFGLLMLMVGIALQRMSRQRERRHTR